MPLIAAVPVSVRFSIAPRLAREKVRARLDRVGAVAAGLVDDVADIVDHVGIVAEAAEHRVGAGAAIERVIAGEAPQDVVAGIAGEGVVEGRAREVLEARQGVGVPGAAAPSFDFLES